MMFICVLFIVFFLWFPGCSISTHDMHEGDFFAKHGDHHWVHHNNGTKLFKKNVRVKVFHYILAHWGDSYSGDYSCDRHIKCDWIVSDQLYHLKNAMNSMAEQHSSHSVPFLTVGLYNIHTLWEKYRDLKPQTCQLMPNLTMFETEESEVRFSWYFDNARQYFDGFSSTHPSSSVQRVYNAAFLNETEFLPLKNFTSLVKAGAYIASDCHRHDGANANRDNVVRGIRDNGFRVDGLGRCLRTDVIPEGINLQKFRQNTRYNLYLKREVINNYAFTMAFENSIEDGYVTEKPFDALMAGSVPVFLGDAKHLKSILPHPKAAIFVSDYENIADLAKYLSYLMTNETAYEEHRSWRNTYNLESNVKDKPLMQKSWQCRICEWAAKQYYLLLELRSKGLVEPYTPSSDNIRNSSIPHFSNHVCVPPVVEEIVRSKLSQEHEGRLYRPNNQRGIYLVKEGVLRLFPDFQTFVSLGFDLSNVKVITPGEFDHMIIGDQLPRVIG